MTPEQAKQLQDVNWLIYNSVIPALEAIKVETDTIQPPLGNVDWLVYNSVIPTLADLSARLAAIEESLGLESDPLAVPQEPPG